MNARERNVERVIPLIVQAVQAEEIEQVVAICYGLQHFPDAEAAYLIAIATTEELLHHSPDLGRWFMDLFFANSSVEMRQDVERVLKAELIDNVGFPMSLHDRCVEISRTLQFSLYPSEPASELPIPFITLPEASCPLDL